MPVIKILTSVHSHKILEDFEDRLAQLLAESMNKKKEFMFVAISPELRMARGGSKKPSAIVEVTSNSGLSDEENERHTIAICEFLKKELGLEATEIIINFSPISAEMIGYNGHVLTKLVKQ